MCVCVCSCRPEVSRTNQPTSGLQLSTMVQEHLLWGVSFPPTSLRRSNDPQRTLYLYPACSTYPCSTHSSRKNFPLFPTRCHASRIHDLETRLSRITTCQNCPRAKMACVWVHVFACIHCTILHVLLQCLVVLGTKQPFCVYWGRGCRNMWIGLMNLHKMWPIHKWVCCRLGGRSFGALAA